MVSGFILIFELNISLLLGLGQLTPECDLKCNIRVQDVLLFLNMPVFKKPTACLFRPQERWLLSLEDITMRITFLLLLQQKARPPGIKFQRPVKACSFLK